MSRPALATSGLNKSFGSLEVARDIAIALPEGARYAPSLPANTAYTSQSRSAITWPAPALTR